MSIKTIDKHPTLFGYLNNGLVIAVLLFIVFVLATMLNQDAEKFFGQVFFIGGVAFVLCLIFAAYKVRSNSKQIAARAVEINNLVKTNNWHISPGNAPLGMKYSSLQDVADRDRRYVNYIKGEDWEYADLSYGIYRKTKNGEYKAATAYYSVMSVALPRQLPNVVFDSLKQRGKQFHPVFDKQQLHRLEGGFDEHFMTYFAQDYTIDSLSFITPDVMEALIAADDYDIEIVGNQLLLYGPMAAPGQQIPEMVQKLTLIKRQLLDNILTYRDERLPFHEGRQKVAAQGMYLKRRKKTIWLTLAGITLYILFRLIIDIMQYD